jgi:hypothetical protein
MPNHSIFTYQSQAVAAGNNVSVPLNNNTALANATNFFMFPSHIYQHKQLHSLCEPVAYLYICFRFLPNNKEFVLNTLRVSAAKLFTWGMKYIT